MLLLGLFSSVLKFQRELPPLLAAFAGILLRFAQLLPFLEVPAP